MRVEIVVIVEPGKDYGLLNAPCLRKAVVISDGPPITTDLIRFDAWRHKLEFAHISIFKRTNFFGEFLYCWIIPHSILARYELIDCNLRLNSLG